MSRVTPPVTKMTYAAVRSLTPTARSASRDMGRHVSIYLPRKLSELRNECSSRQLNANGNKLELIDRLTAHDVTSRAEFHTMGSHRPTASRETRIPLMQGFRTSAPKPAALDASTIDYFFMPDVPGPAPENPFAQLRVPLMPDNYTSSHAAAEALDEALPGPQISVVAHHPEYVLPAVMSEVVGNDGLDVDIGQLTRGFTHTPTAYVKPVAAAVESRAEPSGLQQLWDGVVDDIFGPKSPVPKAA